MADARINGKQMRRLQTLWGLFCRQAKLDAKDRGARLGWVAGVVGRQLNSFSELSAREAKTSIDAIQKHLPAELLRRARPGRDRARAYGTAGRRGSSSNEMQLADAQTWALLDRLLVQLGWTRERLDAFLRSSRSPVRSGAIRTLAEANRAIWALKQMLRRAEEEARRPEPAIG